MHVDHDHHHVHLIEYLSTPELSTSTSSKTRPRLSQLLRPRSTESVFRNSTILLRDALDMSARAVHTNGWDARTIYYMVKYYIALRAPSDYAKVRILWPLR